MFLLSSILFLFGPAVRTADAQDNLYIYPKNGQSDEQQKKDRYECHMWAVQQTGFDPTAPQQSTASSAPQRGQAVRGAGRGAALGAIGGAIGGDAGKGAAIGAAVGGTAGVLRRAGEERKQEEREAAANAAAQNNRAQYNRALTTCLEARGYTVN
jgi:hypothetical protein